MGAADLFIIPGQSVLTREPALSTAAFLSQESSYASFQSTTGEEVFVF